MVELLLLGVIPLGVFVSMQIISSEKSLEIAIFYIMSQRDVKYLNLGSDKHRLN